MFVSCCVKCLVSVLVDSPNYVINFLFSNFYINEISTLHGPGVRLWRAILHPHSYWHFLPSFQNINGIQFICVSSSGWMWLAGEDIRPHLRCVSTVKWVWGPWPWPVATTAPLFITGLGPGAGDRGVTARPAQEMVAANYNYLLMIFLKFFPRW